VRMRSLLPRLRDYLVRRLILDPSGYGRPVRKEILDREYSAGHWDHFFEFSELPRNLIIAGAVNHLSSRPSVLDLGCGSGCLAKILQHYPLSQYIGVDLSSEGLARARALNLPNMTFVEGDFEVWRPERRFDAIVFNECIGYATDPAATLSAFIPHLSDRGQFFLSVYRFGNYRALWRRMERRCSVMNATSVTSAKGQVWDIKVLKPLPPAK
jgi:trans-aconitate methyltransferase